MKRFISCLLILTFLLTFIPGCTDTQAEDPEEILDAEIHEQYENLLASFDSSTDVADMESYLLHWAKANDIRTSYDSYHNVIMSKKASEGYENVDTTLFQCTLALDDLQKRCKSIATALYILKNAQDHGFIRVIFTADRENSTISGAETIANNYLNTDNLISLDWDQKNSLLTSGAGRAEYTMTRTLTWNEPAYYKAYELSIQRLSGGDSKAAGSYPNPIKTLGDLLATAKSNSILFELASFNGGLSADTYPQAATAVVIITQNDINRFTKHVETSRSKFEDKYASDHPDYTYTFTEVELPDKVISNEDCNSLISFLYTMINGTYLKTDNGNIAASTNLGEISTYTGNLTVRTSALSLSQEILDEITLVFDTICGLSEFDYEYKDTFPVWEYQEADTRTEALLAGLRSATNETFGKEAKSVSTFEPTACAVLKKRNPALAAVAFGITTEDFVEQTEALILFLKNMLPEETYDSE